VSQPGRAGDVVDDDRVMARELPPDRPEGAAQDVEVGAEEGAVASVRTAQHEELQHEEPQLEEASDDPGRAGAAARPRRYGASDARSSSAGRAARGPRPLTHPGDRFRALAFSAMLVLVLGYLAAVLVAALAGLTAGAGFGLGALLATAVPLWLAAHQVPLNVAGAPLGVLPLLPTVGMVALVARIAGRATRRLGGRCREDCSVVVATLTCTSASAAVLATALPAGPVQATPWAALLGAGLVTAAGAGLGGLRVSGAPAWWSRAPHWLHTGLVAALTGLAGLAVAGSLLLVAALLVDADATRVRLLAQAPGFGAMLGLTVLSFCYLPNALVASVAWTLGPGLSIGAAAASPLAVRTGPLPGIPVLAAMPVLHPPAWSVVVFVLPVLAGVLVGLRCRRLPDVRSVRLRAAAVGAVGASVLVGGVAALVSGRLAGGPYDPVLVPAVSSAGAALGWLLVPAVVVALLPVRGTRLG
jgi:uncharacterized protein DUF6350